MADTVRLQVELDGERMEELEDLRRLGGLKSKRELLNNALTLIRWAARERSLGRSICSVNPNGQLHKELEMPFLEAVATSMQRAAAAMATRNAPAGADITAGTTQEKEEPEGSIATAGYVSGPLRMIGRL